MELDHFNAHLGCRIDLFESRIDKEADPNASGVKPFYRILQCFAMPNYIKTAFGRNLLALFRDEADFVRQDAQRNINDLFCITHFEIQFRHDVLAQSLDISILNVAAISAQMGNDPASPGSLAN